MSALFGHLTAGEPDKILKLMDMFRADPRTDKVDLGVGVYRTAQGATPVFRAVKSAEQIIFDTQHTKTYTALSGDPVFHRALGGLVLGEDADWNRLAALATPGGTGALRQGLELIKRARPDANIWLPDTTWANHPALVAACGMRIRSYRYLNSTGTAIDPEALRDDLAGVADCDVIMLHGCCHNPTGIDLRQDDWDFIAALCARTGAMPFVDIAYQGFGDGVAEDARGLQRLATALPEMLVAVSCSKNFGLYRDRAGLLLALAETRMARDTVQSVMDRINRLSYAFPPDHGARVVSTILETPDLRADWMTEINEMRTRLTDLRSGFAQSLRDAAGSDRFHFIAEGRGLFSLLPATPDQVRHIRETDGVYLIEDGRINIAGLTQETIAKVAAAVVAAGV